MGLAGWLEVAVAIMTSNTIKSWIIISLCFLYASRHHVICAPKPGCSPIDVEDVLAAAQCSEIIYERGPIDLGEGSRIADDSEYRIIEGGEFDYNVTWTEETPRGETPARKRWTETGEYLKAIIVQNDEASPTTMFCFMGTNSQHQLDEQTSNSLDAVCVDYETGEEIDTGWKWCSYWSKGVSIFEYDWVRYQHFIQFIKTKFVPLVKPGGKYIIAGHSLGGALSDLLALMMTRLANGELWKNTHSSLITFGQPATGKGNFATAIDKLIPLEQKLRFVYRKDSVPRLPPFLYHHHSREIYLTDELEGEDDAWVVCPPRDEEICASKYPYLHKDVNNDDHDMGNYLEAVQQLINGPGEKLERFMSDQCEAEDTPNLTELKALRLEQKKAAQEKRRKEREERDRKREERRREREQNPRKSKKNARKSKKNPRKSKKNPRKSK